MAVKLAPLVSPVFTGTPQASTAAVDTSSTQLATTGFVLQQLSSSTPLIDGTAAVGISTRFARADHVHPSDTTRAQDSLVVHLAGTETITGAKTFSLATLITLGATASTTPLNVTGSINNFFELNLQNTSSGAAASSDLVITANTGTSTTNFIDLGINGSAFSGSWGGALDGYLYSSDTNLWVGSSAAGKNLILTAGNGGATAIVTVGSSLVTVAQPLSNTSGRLKNIQVKTANYTLVSTDHIIVGNNSSTFTLTLPAASTNASREYIIKNKGTATVTVDATGAGLIDGQNTTTVTQYSAITLISDGTTWNAF